MKNAGHDAMTTHQVARRNTERASSRSPRARRRLSWGLMATPSAWSPIDPMRT